MTGAEGKTGRRLTLRKRLENETEWKSQKAETFFPPLLDNHLWPTHA